MAQRLNWENLLSTKRVSDFDVCKLSAPLKSQFIDPRSAFERDFDQLIFSYPFRRLQDKTQVVPFPEFDFVHTRLTHTLEVASIGRSLGKMAAEIIYKELPENFSVANNISKSDIGALLAAACLAHDIGNPPFGHSGEDSISYYFMHSENGQDLEPENFHNSYSESRTEQEATELYLNTKRWTDLTTFEGNANGFRIITRNCEKGINPTAALLGTFTKYPRESWLINDPFSGLSKKQKPKSQAKYGFFQEQRKLFKDICEELRLIPIQGIYKDDIAYRRHPLAFLMEAADDIAYIMIDFEDGCRLKLIDFDKPYQLQENPIVIKTPREILIEIAEIDSGFDKSKIIDAPDYKYALSYLRSKVINVLTHSAFEIFSNNYELIMTGNFDKSIVDCIGNKTICDNLKFMKDLVAAHLYNYKPVLESEASGFEVMGGLIESFALTSNVCLSCDIPETARHKKLKSLLPKEFHPSSELQEGNLTFEEKYSRLLKVLDYVSGMTDHYAVSLYRRIKGISLPNW